MKLKILRTAVLLAGMTILFGNAVMAAPQPLRVVVTPSTNVVRILEPFPVALRVENQSQTDQTIRVMSCSWEEEWKFSNTNIGWAEERECAWNVEQKVDIPPGGAYTNAWQMGVYRLVRSKEVSFRMGFTSIGSSKTLWGNKVKLRVLPPDTWWRGGKYFHDRNHDGKIDWEVSGKLQGDHAVYPHELFTNSAGTVVLAQEVYTYKVDANYDGFYDLEYGAGGTNGQIQWTKPIHEPVPALGKDFIPAAKQAWMDWWLPK